MPHRHLLTIGHFIGWGAIYGLVLGGLCGTLIFPVFGTMYAAPWGLGIGITLGVVVGVGMALINATHYNVPYDLVRYRRRYTWGVSLFVAVGAPFLLTITTNGFLWGEYTEGWLPYFLPCLLGAAFWGALSSAYATSWYADWYAGIITKQKNDLGTEDTLVQKYGIMNRFASQLLRRDWRLVALVVLIVGYGLVVSIVSPPYWSTMSIVWYTIQNIANVGLVVVGAAFVCMLTGSYLTLFVNRVFLLEQGWLQTPEKLQNFVRSLVVGFFMLILFTFSLQMNFNYMTVLYLLPYGLAALLILYTTWRMTEGFGEWYFREEKVKSKPKVEQDVMEEAVA
jgi:hypothetical protein